jgi:outer membrane protein
MNKKVIQTLAIFSFAFAMIFAMPSSANAQKYAYVDTQYILDNIPEYQDAQDELDEVSEKWQKEIEAKYKEVEEMYKQYQAEAVLLPADIKKQKEEAIIKKEKEVKDLQKKYFSPEGELFKKRQELVQPIQEKVYNAIESIAQTRNYGFVFDRSAGMTLLYGDPKLDISDEVLDEVGNVMQTVKKEQRKKSN